MLTLDDLIDHITLRLAELSRISRTDTATAERMDELADLVLWINKQPRSHVIEERRQVRQMYEQRAGI